MKPDQGYVKPKDGASIAYERFGQGPAFTVDEYLEAQPKSARAALERIREVIKSAAPDAVEGISYRIPVYKQQGVLVGFAAFPSHCAFYPMSTTVLADFMPELKKFKVVGTTVHFKSGGALPTKLVKEIVQARLAENRARKKR